MVAQTDHQQIRKGPISLRIRGKMLCGFATVLVISAISLAMALLGFERVASMVAAYRTSVAEADDARDIDRELTAYRLSTRHYTVTGKEDDANAAKVVEASLRIPTKSPRRTDMKSPVDSETMSPTFPI